MRLCKVNIYNELHIPRFRDQCMFFFILTLIPCGLLHEKIMVQVLSFFYSGRTSSFSSGFFKNYYLKYPIAFNYASDCASFDDKLRFQKVTFKKFS